MFRGSEIDNRCPLFDEEQLLDLENDDGVEGEDAQDLELKGLDVAIYEK